MIDSVVLDNLKLALPRSGCSDARINGIVRIHEQIKHAFTDFLQSEGGPELTARFSAQFPQASVTEMKMLDLVLWQTGRPMLGDKIHSLSSSTVKRYSSISSRARLCAACGSVASGASKR